MDSRGGCCIARYAGGGAYDTSKVDRIMLRFRPIAPKPAGGGSVSGATTPPQKAEVPVRTGRGKRRYVRDNNNNTSSISNKKSNSGGNGSRKRKTPSSSENDSTGKSVSGGGGGGETVVTLPFLSEVPEGKYSPSRVFSNDELTKTVKKTEQKAPIWLNFGNQGGNDINHGQVEKYGDYCVDRSVRFVPEPVVKVVGSWVRVESVTDAWVQGYGLGCTDEEKVVNLDNDTCPGFVSDGLNRVRWANRAYKEIVGQGEDGDVVVWLAVKDGVRLPESQTTVAFTCRVRVVTCGNEKKSLVLPCDVWRLDGGGYAWRLDTKAALSLGR